MSRLEGPARESPGSLRLATVTASHGAGPPRALSEKISSQVNGPASAAECQCSEAPAFVTLPGRGRGPPGRACHPMIIM